MESSAGQAEKRCEFSPACTVLLFLFSGRKEQELERPLMKGRGSAFEEGKERSSREGLKELELWLLASQDRAIHRTSDGYLPSKNKSRFHEVLSLRAVCFLQGETMGLG